MGRWYLGQLASGATLEDATFLDVEMPSDAGGSGGGLVVFRHPGLEHYQRLIEAARSRLANVELDDGVEKSKVDSVRSRLFSALRSYYQERDRLPGLRSVPVRRGHGEGNPVSS